MMFRSNAPREYSDDIFEHTKMSFGDHIEELRTRLLRALLGLGIIVLAGFLLDFVGIQLGKSYIGLGRPVTQLIVEPVKEQVRNFYNKKNQTELEKVKLQEVDPEEVARIEQKLKENDYDYSSLTSEEQTIMKSAPKSIPVKLSVDELKKTFPNLQVDEKATTTVSLQLQVFPAYFPSLNSTGETVLNSGKYLTTLSAQEALVVYFKVTLLCGVVLGSPWIFYQIWAFVAAGLYPHERRYVYSYLPMAIFLFISGVLLCQFVVLPGAVKALLAFNNWIDLDPDLRLNEWLSFALILPVVFGVSFQTPMVMVLMNRMGMFTAEDYWAKWRYAMFILAVFAAIITPTPDVVTMSYLFIPMFGLYAAGVAICYYFPADWQTAEAADEAQISV